MKENTKKKTKKKIKKQRLMLVIVLIVLMCICALVQCSGHKINSSARGNETEKENHITTEYEQDVDQIKEIDYTKQQEALNAIVEKGKMNVNYCSKAIFHGQYSQVFNVKNIKNNHYPIAFEIYDEHNECIYTSKKIEPGYELNSIKLEKALSKGTHECKLKVGYVQEGNVSSIFPITIEVR